MSPLVMGVLNVTPDSFSDGGQWFDGPAAIEHGLAMVAAGAELVDVGGESTRPGAEPVATPEELRRVLPVVEALAPHTRVSIDTMKPEVAEAAVEAGATMVNDVSGSLDLAGVAARAGAGWVCMHMQGTPRTMQQHPQYVDVVGEVRAWLTERAEAGRALGVTEVWIDPGIGFGKAIAHNLTLLAHLDELVATGWPVLVGTSRKSFLGTLESRADGDERPAAVDDRLEGSLASVAWAAAQGVYAVRVHDVEPTVATLAAVARGRRRVTTTHDQRSAAESARDRESLAW